MNFGALQTAVLARLNLGTDDPAADAVDSLVNEAIQMVAVARPNGWPWLRSRVNWTTVANTGGYTFASLSTTSTIVRVLSVRATISQSYRNLDVISPEDADSNYIAATATGAPECYWVEGNTVTVYPSPDSTYSLSARVVLGEPELSADGDEPLCPERYHPAIIAGALVVYYELLQDTARSQAAAQRYDGWIGRMEKSAPDLGGLPRIRVRGA